MVKLAMIADDFTGALDTGIQFAEKGIETKVILDTQYSFSDPDSEAQVVVIDAETRHLSPQNAYQIVYGITKRALASGAQIIYKKTDSALRGCIGSELDAVLDAAGENEIEFLPALPRAGRITVGGVQYLDNKPIETTVFGTDPFEPVRHSYIPDIIREQSSTMTVVVPVGGDLPDIAQKHITVFDAQTDEELSAAAERLQKCGKLRLLAGCAGLAAFLSGLIPFKSEPQKRMSTKRGLLVICGSLNPITEGQLDFAEKNGFLRVNLTPEQKLMPHYLETQDGRSFVQTLKSKCQSGVPVIVDIFSKGGQESSDLFAQQLGIPSSEIRTRIASRMGQIAKEWLNLGLDGTIVLTGGDTLIGFLREVQCRQINPLYEIAPGAVLSLLDIDGKKTQVISKSGGFGTESILLDIADKVMPSYSRRAHSKG